MSNQTDKAIIENHDQSSRVSGWVKASVTFLVIATLMLIGAGVYGYWQLQDLQNQTFNQQKNVTRLQADYNNLQQMADKSVELSKKQEQMIADWQAAQKGNLNKWYVAESQYLVRIANDHLLFTQNSAMVLTLLQRADQVLQNLHDMSSRVMELRRSLAENILVLQQHPTVDINNLYLQLTGLNQQIDQLLLPTSPLKPEKINAHPPEDATATWWQKGINKTWDMLSKIVIIRNNSTNMLPLVMPDEKVFLYQNLHAQMENVMWAVLHRNNDVYQASLKRMISWIQQYFDQEAAVTKAVLQRLAELQKTDLQAPALKVNATLQLFDNYFANADAV